MKIHVPTFALLLSFAGTLPAYADLDNRTYRAAKAAYTRGDCATALPLLRQYYADDHGFLYFNQEIRVLILNAISHCESVGSMSALAGISVSGPRREPPPLPE